MKIRSRGFVSLACGAALVFSLQGCGPAPQAVKPVVLQNQQNINALSQNVQILMSLYEPLLAASTKALIYQHISTIRKDLIGVVGASTFGETDSDWAALFANARNKEYNERYQYAHSAVARGISGIDIERLRQKEGWVYTAAAHPDVFTPKVAQALVKELAELQKSSADLDSFFATAEQRLAQYDGTLEMYRRTTDGAAQLFAGLKQEIDTQLGTAATHSKAMNDYAESNITAQEVAANVDPAQVSQILSNLGSKYIQDPATRQAAIDMFTQGIGSLFK